MSSANKAFLEICGLPIWATGDGLDLGGKKAPEEIPDLGLSRGSSRINTKSVVRARWRNF